MRAYKPEPVPADLLDQVFTAALRAPSNCNTQPWQVHVASGAAIEKLRESLPTALSNMEFSMEAGLPMRAHRYVAAVDLDLANPNEPQQAGLTGPEIIPVGFAVNTVAFGGLLFVACLGIMRLTGGKRGG